MITETGGTSFRRPWKLGEHVIVFGIAAAMPDLTAGLPEPAEIAYVSPEHATAFRPGMLRASPGGDLSACRASGPPRNGAWNPSLPVNSFRASSL